MTVTVITPKDYTNAAVDSIVTGNSVNVFSFIPSSLQSDILANASSVDVTSYLQAAHDAAGQGGFVYYPPGTYPCSQVAYYTGQSVRGAGANSTILTKIGLLGAVAHDILVPYDWYHNNSINQNASTIQDMSFIADNTSVSGFGLVVMSQRSQIYRCTFSGISPAPFGAIRLTNNTSNGTALPNDNNISGTHVAECHVRACLLGGIYSHFTRIVSIAANVSITLDYPAVGTTPVTYTDVDANSTFSGTPNGTTVVAVANTSGLTVGDQITGTGILTDSVSDVMLHSNVISNSGSSLIGSVHSPSLAGWNIQQNKLETNTGPVLIGRTKAHGLFIGNNVFAYNPTTPTAGNNICMDVHIDALGGRMVCTSNSFKLDGISDSTKTFTIVNISRSANAANPAVANIFSNNAFSAPNIGPFATLTCFTVNDPANMQGIATGNSYDPAYTGAQRGNGDVVWAAPNVVPLNAGLTAHAGGGQANAVLLKPGMNELLVCATNGDSVKLPPATGSGVSVEVGNDGAATCAVFPNTGDKINRGAANASVNLASGVAAIYRDFAAGLWRSIP